MRLFSKAKDGGPHSTVTGYWLVEIKPLFSVVLLRFDKGSRDAYHSHAFNALSWFLSGEVEEHHKDGRMLMFRPSIVPKWTPRSCFHKVYARRTTWCLSVRGPWTDTWAEYIPSNRTLRTLTNGRREINVKVQP
jgi:hypothetical protein